MDNLRQTTQTLNQTAEKVRERMNTTQQEAEEALEEGQARWKEFRKKGSAALGEAQKQGKELWGDSLDLVRKHPAQAVGIAVATGLILGAIIASSWSDD